MNATATRSAGLVRYLMPLLLLLSGFCGISYEILYTKLLGNLLGNQFTINAAVLLTFLLGIGLGTLQAHRLRGYLWAIEAGIGLYAVLMVLGYDVLDQVLYSMLPGTNLYLAALVSFAVLLVPAFLIGCSIPLFAGYLALLRESRVFSVTYAIYNLGAGLTALGMEFVLLREVGLKSATLILASLNVVVAAGVWLASRSLNVPALSGWTRFPRRVLAALAVASVASAVFQLLMIKLTEFVLGPFNETFSLVLATVLLGLALGSIVAGRLHCSFHQVLLFGAGGTLGVLLLFPLIVEAYAQLYPAAVESYYLLVALKLGLVVVLMGIPAVGFGATIPALLHTHKHVARESGQLLFVSCLANALGFLLMAFVLHRLLDYGPILVLIVALAAAAVWIERGWTHIGSRTAAVLVALCLPAFLIGWNEGLLYLGHTAFHSAEDLKVARRSIVLDQRFKGAQDVFAITRKNGKPYFFINGYISIPLSNASEKIVGALSAMISPRLDQALVLGVGSGATAATVGLLFEHADAVEINKVVLDNLHLMSEYNFDIQTLPGLEIHHDDGIRFLRTGEKKYSLILNTVTSPLYFSSSKLYTKDMFDLAVDRLTPDGVYMTWIDVEIGDGGMAIILESLGRSFEHCWLSVIKNDYFLLGCSNEEIRLRQFEAVAANPTLKNYLADEHAIPIRFLHYNVISTDALALGAPPPVPVNTLDFPVLEFEMAQLQADRLTGFKRRLDRRMDLKGLQETLGRDVDWLAEEFALNLDLRLPRRGLYSLLEEHITRVFPEAYGRYVGTVRSAVAEFESAGAAWTLAKRLKRRDRLDAADVAYRRVLELDPSFPGAHLALAGARYDAEQYDVALEHLRTEWAHGRDGDTARLMARTLIALEHYDVALRWLDTAADMDGFRDRPYREHYYRGIAHEGLLQLEQARREFGQALRLNPDSVSTRRALNRVESAL